MTPEEIKEGNKLIAEFMGWKYDYSGINWAVPANNTLIPESDNYQSGTRLPDEKLRFNKDWSWLMPVVEKVGNIFYLHKYSVSYVIDSQIGTVITVHFHQPDDTKQRTIKQFFHETTYGSVVKFIKWYNQNKI